MKKLEKLQKADIFWKKMVVFGALFVLAIPLIIIVVVNLSNRMSNLETKNVFNEINLPQTDSSGLEALLEQLNNLATTTATTSYAQEETN